MTHASNTHSRHDEPETHHTQNESSTHHTRNESGTHRTYDGPGAHHRTHEDADSHNGGVLVTKDGLPPGSTRWCTPSRPWSRSS